MGKKKRVNKRVLGVIIGIVIVLAVLFTFGFLQTFFVSEQRMIQYFVEDGDSSRVADHFRSSFPQGEFFGSTKRLTGGQTTNVFANSQFSDEVEVNTGKNNYKFVAEKVNSGKDFGLNDGRGGALNYCWQRIDVYKNGQKIDTLESWEDENGKVTNRDFWNGKQYFIADDDSGQSGVIVTMQTSAGNDFGVFANGCPYWFNTYQVKLSDETLKVDVEVPESQLGTNKLDLTLSINNQLSSDLRANIEVKLAIPTSFGDFDKEINQEIVLKPGENKIKIPIEAQGSIESVKIKTDVRVSMSGSNFKGLNWKESAVPVIAKCFNTRGDGSCEEYNLFRNGGAQGKISSEEWIEIGKVDVATIVIEGETIEIIEPVVETEEINEETTSSTEDIDSEDDTNSEEKTIGISDSGDGPNKIAIFLWSGIGIVGVFLIIVGIIAWRRRR